MWLQQALSGPLRVVQQLQPRCTNVTAAVVVPLSELVERDAILVLDKGREARRSGGVTSHAPYHSHDN